MAKWLALLRGINVSGQKPIRMVELCSWMEDLGFASVATYIQTGNIVFNSPERSGKKLAQQIHEQIYKRSGFEVPVVMRTEAQMQSIGRNNPFQAKAEFEGKSVHVAFLSAKPKAEGLAKMAAIDSGDDRFESVGQELFLHFPHGAGRTKLWNSAMERKLGVDATGRNWKTVLKLQKMLKQLP
jgi:uncharacterized protein (DUF1697 family)